MNRTELKRQVSITGPSFLGLATTCVLEPLGRRGIYVKLPNANVVPLGEMTLSVNRVFRFLTLSCQDYVLRIPEHLLGLIFALGLDGIVIVPQHFRLPYDGRAKIFWDAVKDTRHPVGALDWFTPTAPLTVTRARDRYIEILPAPAGSRCFSFEINVGYPKLGEMTLRGIVGEEQNDERLSTARPYWNSTAHRALARLARCLGWPQGDIGVWLSSATEEDKASVLEELCWHRLLDMLGMFATLMPPGGRIAGSVVTRRVGHVADVELMHRLKKERFVQV
jgi:UDP-3-O-acyl-N-acetylglucosamine deacetylase